MSRPSSYLIRTFTVRDIIWLTALVSVVVAWRAEFGAKHRKYRSAWRTMAAECQEVRSQLKTAQQQLARRETVLTRQFLPVLKGMGEFAPEDRLAYLEKFMDENNLLVIKYANAKRDTQELLVFGKALWMLSQAFRDMADADRRRSAEHAVTGVVEQEDDSRPE